MKRWAHMSKTFTRIGREITMAAKAGGIDPDTNARLRAILQNAKSENMPKDNIERAIKKAADKDTTDYKRVLFEGYAPHGIAVLVETATDNKNRTVANVRSYFNKYHGSLATSGSVEFMFEHKCCFKIRKGTIDIEELELELIDYGAEELFAEEEHIIIYGDFSSYGSLQRALEDMGYEIVSSEFERLPAAAKELSIEQAVDVERLLEKLDEDEDVQHVYHTLA